MMAFIFLNACKQPEVDMRETIRFHYHARKCNFIWTDNIKSEVVTIEGVSGTINTPLKENSTVKISEYSLFLNTCNVNSLDIPISDYQKLFLSEQYNPLQQCPFMALAELQNPMSDEADKTIENKIQQFLSRTYKTAVSSQPQAILEHVDYRTTVLTKITITCSKDLFGVKSGESLNDYFIINGYPTYHNFIISSDKQLVTGKVQNISIAQYLSYSPMAPSAIYFQLKKGTSISESLQVEFSIHIEVDGKKAITATTKPITLIP